MFVPLIDTFKQLMKESGHFDHVASWFSHLIAVEIDNAFPSVQFNIPEGTMEQVALTPGFADSITVFEIHYFSKHFQRMIINEMYHFIEKTIQIVESNKKTKFKYKDASDTSKCDIRSAKVTDFMVEFDYDDGYIINHAVVTVEVRLPTCKHLSIT